MIEYLAPQALAAYDRLMGSCRELEAARLRAHDTDLRAAGPHRVTAESLARLASSPRASIALSHYAGRVTSGECSWERVEVDAHPLPPEIGELKADPQIDWPTDWPTPATEMDTDSPPYRIPWE